MIERLAIADIVIGERRRQDLGDIASLARNINEHGLLHPIIVAADNALIAGERRLRACQHLGQTTIDVRRWPDLTEDERREIELAENLDRKDLTPAERSRQMVQLADVTAEVLPTVGRTQNGGRPPKDRVSESAVAERMGVPQQTLNRAKRHVAAIDAYPELTPLPQTEAIQAARILDAMPAGEREEAREAIAAQEAAEASQESHAWPVGVDIRDVAAALPDSTGRREFERARYRSKLGDSLGHMATLASKYDPAHVAQHIDEQFYAERIERPLRDAMRWAERVRAEMPATFQVIAGGRS